MVATKLIIAGTRTFNDVELARKEFKKFMKYMPDEIVSGGATGADSIGEQIAREKKIFCKRFLPDWDKHGRAAGPIRNKEMAEYATHCLLFWDGASRGTLSMANEARKAGVILKIVRYAKGR